MDRAFGDRKIVAAQTLANHIGTDVRKLGQVSTDCPDGGEGERERKRARERERERERDR